MVPLQVGHTSSDVVHLPDAGKFADGVHRLGEDTTMLDHTDSSSERVQKSVQTCKQCLLLWEGIVMTVAEGSMSWRGGSLS